MSTRRERLTDDQVVVKPKVKRPRQYKVILHNDDYTTMEFVIYIIMTVFNKTEDEASHLMYTVHYNGYAVCGVYSKEIAETKRDKVMSAAKQEGYPMLCTIEAE